MRDHSGQLLYPNRRGCIFKILFENFQLLLSYFSIFQFLFVANFRLLLTSLVSFSPILHGKDCYLSLEKIEGGELPV